MLGTLYGVFSPALEKPDEEWHYAYVRYLGHQGVLPPITTEESRNPARQEAGQPPLFYATAAGMAHILRLDLQAPQISHNPHWGYPARGTVNDNKNRFVHPSDEWRESSLRALFGLRFFRSCWVLAR